MMKVGKHAKSILDLNRLLTPSAIAIIGASSNPTAVGGQPLRHLARFGYGGRLFPVNPKRGEINGIRCYPELKSVPEPCDVAIIAVPAADVPAAIIDCGIAHIPFAVILSGGFAGDDEEHRLLRQELGAAIQQAGVRAVGPNCVGVASIASSAVCAFGGALFDPDIRPGPVAVVSQSGGMGLGILAHLASAGIGCHSVISCGEEVDLTAFDFIDVLLESPEVSTLALYMESYTDGRRLREIGRRALELGKPILVMKTGNNRAGQRAAASHTGRMTADYSLYHAAFEEGGYIEVQELDEMADLARLVLGGRKPKGRNVAITTASGGWGVMLAEQCERNGLEVSEFTESTAAELMPFVPAYGSLRNPVDVTPGYYADKFEGYNKVLEALLRDSAVDQVIVRAPQGPDAPLWAARFVAIAAGSRKPVICNWAATGARDSEIRKLLQDNGILCGSYPTRLVRAVGAFTEFCLRSPVPTVSERGVPIADLRLPRGGSRALSERDAKGVLAAYGIPCTREILLSPDAAASLTELPLPGPLAVKIASADILHKTEVRGIRLGLTSAQEVRDAAQAVLASARHMQPGARIDGVLVQQMAGGLEMMVGAVSHPDFGPYVIVGFGGVLVEMLRDFRIGFAPISFQTAQGMLAGLKAGAMLAGFRGRPACDQVALCESLVRLSWLIADHADTLLEVEVNPLFVHEAGRGVTAADALVTLASAEAPP